ncbi:MAG: type II secretion system protein [Pseudomonadota bacterium]
MLIKSTAEQGFTLLEAIVALVVLASALASLFGLINTDLRSLRRAEAVVSSQNIMQEALEQLQLLPLADDANGIMRIGGVQLRWSARLLEPVSVGRTPRGGVGAYDHSLYQVALAVGEPGQEQATWITRVTQHIRVRKFEDDLL